MHCEACGALNPDRSALYCSSCGSPMPKASPRMCPACGTENPNDADFCMNCGGRLEAEERDGLGALLPLAAAGGGAAAGVGLAGAAGEAAAASAPVITGAGAMAAPALTGAGAVAPELAGAGAVQALAGAGAASESAALSGAGAMSGATALSGAGASTGGHALAGAGSGSQLITSAGSVIEPPPPAASEALTAPPEAPSLPSGEPPPVQQPPVSPAEQPGIPAEPATNPPEAPPSPEAVAPQPQPVPSPGIPNIGQGASWLGRIIRIASISLGGIGLVVIVFAGLAFTGDPKPCVDRTSAVSAAAASSAQAKWEAFLAGSPGATVEFSEQEVTSRAASYLLERDVPIHDVQVYFCPDGKAEAKGSMSLMGRNVHVLLRGSLNVLNNEIEVDSVEAGNLPSFIGTAAVNAILDRNDVRVLPLGVTLASSTTTDGVHRLTR